jgi:hypothetical protein
MVPTASGGSVDRDCKREWVDDTLLGLILSALTGPVAAVEQQDSRRRRRVFGDSGNSPRTFHRYPAAQYPEVTVRPSSCSCDARPSGQPDDCDWMNGWRNTIYGRIFAVSANLLFTSR